MSLIRITSNSRITIPKDVREKLGINKGDYVLLIVDGQKAIMSPIRKESLSSLRSRLPATRPYPGNDQVSREVCQKLAKRGLNDAGNMP